MTKQRHPELDSGSINVYYRINYVRKIDNIKTYFIEIEFGHLHSLSNIICLKSEYVFEKITDLSCEASALQSEKNSRH